MINVSRTILVLRRSPAASASRVSATTTSTPWSPTAVMQTPGSASGVSITPKALLANTVPVDSMEMLPSRTASVSK